MHRWIKTAGLGLFALAACLAPQTAHAQFVPVHSPPPGHVVLPSVSYYAPAPVVSYSPSPFTVYSAPVTYYSAPPVSYYPAPVTFYAPPVTYYSAPAVVGYPGGITTRTYTGLGIFRPRGTYTETYVAPVSPRTAYYVPWYVR